MQADAIVVALDVGEQTPPDSGAVFGDLVLEELGLDRSERGFGNGVVPAVALTAHADDGLPVAKSSLMVARRVGGAPIGGVGQVRASGVSGHGLVEGLKCEVGVAASTSSRRVPNRRGAGLRVRLAS